MSSKAFHTSSLSSLSSGSESRYSSPKSVSVLFSLTVAGVVRAFTQLLPLATRNEWLCEYGLGESVAKIPRGIVQRKKTVPAKMRTKKI
ncbi:hypothetical protein RRF57_000395 [Xylaria bambusicola]|uniref:Uncharacterized protein n=1 Tax=Xylaria bambusicola TaxID=326684 RepID=A0AAN7UNI9_9PEZI